MNTQFPTSLLWLPENTVSRLLNCYDYPHPTQVNHVIEGYDKHHALRTAKMCAAVAAHLGHDDERVRQYQIACLLHDMGRAGLEQDLFGKIWTWARTNGIPTRPAEWRAAYPDTPYGKETDAFWTKYETALLTLGIETNAWAKEQVEMRLGYATRMHRQLIKIEPELKQNNIEWSDWMELVTLYYYYPEKLADAQHWVHQLGEILVACEQLEAYSNRARGNDYYARNDESFIDAFNYLASLKDKGQLSKQVLSAVRQLTGQGLFDDILQEARDGKLSDKELDFLRSLAQ